MTNCNKCGEPNLTWVLYNSKWLLKNNSDMIHDCNNKQKTPTVKIDHIFYAKLDKETNKYRCPFNHIVVFKSKYSPFCNECLRRCELK